MTASSKRRLSKAIVTVVLIVVLVVVITALSYGLFVWGLGLPFRVWPR